MMQYNQNGKYFWDIGETFGEETKTVDDGWVGFTDTTTGETITGKSKFDAAVEADEITLTDFLKGVMYPTSNT